MPLEKPPVTDLDGTIHYPRRALLSLGRRILRDYYRRLMDEAEIAEDWSIPEFAVLLRGKIDTKAFYTEDGKERTVKQIKSWSDDKCDEDYLLCPRQRHQPIIMKEAVDEYKELRSLTPAGDDGWTRKQEDALLDFLLFIFGSHNNGNLFRAA